MKDKKKVTRDLFLENGLPLESKAPVSHMEIEGDPLYRESGFQEIEICSSCFYRIRRLNVASILKGHDT